MKRLHIVAAIIFNADKTEIFITKRHKDVHKGGLWEFPGGKVEHGETIEQAIVRELFEEIGINVIELTHFQHLDYDYSDKALKFDFFNVISFENAPYGKEGQLGEWVPIKSLESFEFPEANIPILKKVIELYR